MNWNDADKVLPPEEAVRDSNAYVKGIWSVSVVVWYLNKYEEGYFKTGVPYNYKLKRWGGIGGVLDDCTDDNVVTHWMYEEDFMQMITPKN